MLHGEVADVERKLDEAQALLADADSDSEESTLGVHYDASLLTIQTAICHCEAGRADRAVDIYRVVKSSTADLCPATSCPRPRISRGSTR